MPGRCAFKEGRAPRLTPVDMLHLSRTHLPHIHHTPSLFYLSVPPCLPTFFMDCPRIPRRMTHEGVLRARRRRACARAIFRTAFSYTTATRPNVYAARRRCARAVRTAAADRSCVPPHLRISFLPRHLPVFYLFAALYCAACVCDARLRTTQPALSTVDASRTRTSSRRRVRRLLTFCSPHLRTHPLPVHTRAHCGTARTCCGTRTPIPHWLLP